MTCVLAIFVENKIPARQEVSALVVLCVGVMLSVWQGSVSGRPQGVVFCVAGTLCNGAMMTFSGKVLNEKIDVVRLTFYTAPVSLACLMPFFLFFEARAAAAAAVVCAWVWVADGRERAPRGLRQGPRLAHRCLCSPAESCCRRRGLSSWSITPRTLGPS